MLKGFRDFIMRGNVIDLAVGVVIGAAFNGLVTQLTESFITPLIRTIGGSAEVEGGVFKIRGQGFDYAAFINAALSFLITAAVVYFLIVLPMNQLAARRKRGEVPPPAAPSEEIALLTEIRDALVAQRSTAGQATPAQAQPAPAQPAQAQPAPRS